MSAKNGAAWKQERTTGRKHSGADSDKEPAPGERERFWITGYTRADGKQVAGYYKHNPAQKKPASKPPHLLAPYRDPSFASPALGRSRYGERPK